MSNIGTQLGISVSQFTNPVEGTCDRTVATRLGQRVAFSDVTNILDSTKFLCASQQEFDIDVTLRLFPTVSSSSLAIQVTTKNRSDSGMATRGSLGICCCDRSRSRSGESRRYLLNLRLGRYWRGSDREQGAFVLFSVSDQSSNVVMAEEGIGELFRPRKRKVGYG